MTVLQSSKRKCLSDITALLSHAERNETKFRCGFCSLQCSFSITSGRHLVLLGIEKLRVIKGFTAGSMLDSYFHPYSHSLITAVIWSAVAAFVYKTVCGRHPFDSAQGRLSHYNKSAPLIIGLAVFSHWILDLIAHPRDLPIYDNHGRSALVCGIIATRSLRWRSRCSPAASLST